MSKVDIDQLRQWIGREERASEVLTEALVSRFEATLGTSLTRIEGEAPLAIHWCLTQPAVASDGLGVDGHPARGGFLPPVPLPRRMWAGGELTFVAPLRVEETVSRVSRIVDVTHKQGRSGELVFVTLEHEIYSASTLAIRDIQNIVYRDSDTKSAPPIPAAVAPRIAEHSQSVEATTTLLFRYSALTFNGHRIHYDLDYARDEEGYTGLVVHGPLQATLLLHMAAQRNNNRAPHRFSYRGVAPLTHGGRFSLNAVTGDAGLDLWTAGQDGITRMVGSAQFLTED